MIKKLKNPTYQPKFFWDCNPKRVNNFFALNISIHSEDGKIQNNEESH